MLDEDGISSDGNASNVLEAASALASLGGDVRVDTEVLPDNSSSCSSKGSDEGLSNDPKPVNHDGDKKAESFPKKLMELLSNEDSDGAITWLPHGKSFVIVSVEKLAKILPLHFKDHKFSSFVRKLFRWGFRQVEKGPNAQSFFHRYFERDNEEMCQQISCSSYIINSGLHNQAIDGEMNSRGAEQMPCSDVLVLRRRIAISQARVLAHKKQLSFALDSLPNTNISPMPALTPPRFRRHSLAFGDLGRMYNTFGGKRLDFAFEDLGERTKQLQNNMKSLLQMSGKGDKTGPYDCPLSPDAAHVIQQAVDVLK